ncbi:MAG: class I SAM-dependent methyltransferase [Pseudomonadota bacterium]
MTLHHGGRDAEIGTGHGATDWAEARGVKWLRNIAGMEAMLAPIDAPLIEALRLSGPCRIGDLGCGGGATTRSIAERAAPGSTVTGIDIAPVLLERAKQTAGAAGIDTAFHRADIGRDPPPGGAFDRLASRFGIMFFDAPDAAFRNLRGWLVPGGRIAFAVWAAPADNPWMTTVRDVVAGLIGLPPVDPKAPGPFRYAEPDRLIAELAGAGFGTLDARAWHGALPIGGSGSPAEAAAFALSSFATFEEMLLDAGGAMARAEAERRLTTVFARHLDDGAVRLAASVHIVTGDVSSEATGDGLGDTG